MKADIIWLGSTDSTNEEARRRISDIDNLSVLSALEQTAGRGQRGNKWSSAPGENLTFSIILKFRTDGIQETAFLPAIKAYDQFMLTEIASLSMIRFLHGLGISARIKWPNDIYIGSKKICGMLIENSLRGNHISSSIIGIGLNINQRNFDVNIPNPTSVVIESDCDSLDIRKCLDEFIKIFLSEAGRYLKHVSESEKELRYQELRHEYMSYLWRVNEEAWYIDFTSLSDGHLQSPMNIHLHKPQTDGRIFKGIIKGISPSGNILIDDIEKGELKEFAFKEIGYVITH